MRGAEHKREERNLPEQDLEVALIGCGNWGRNYLRVFHELAGVRPAAVCDLKEENLSWAKRHHPGLFTTENYEELLRREGLDALVIAVPASSHFDFALKALEAGKDVLVEKPLALKTSQARQLLDLAHKKKRILMVAHTFLYNPAVLRMKEILQGGDFGRVYYLASTRAHLGLVREDVSAIWDLAPHDVSIFNFLLEAMPLKVSAVGGKYLMADKEDVAFINLVYPGGVVANIHVSWIDSHKVRRVVAVGSHKRVVFDDLDNLERIKVYDKGVSLEMSAESFGDFQFLLRDGNITSPAIKMSEPLKNQCQHFLQCIVTRSEPLTSGKAGLEVVQVLEAVEKSLENEGRLVEV
jgi:predicted dehydrogenase